MVNLRALPWLTIAVFAVTAAVTAAMLVWPQIGTLLQRDPAMLHGEAWRFVTTWLVETDGWGQIAVNFIGLAGFGMAVELLIGRFWWVIGYIVAGLAGEIAGIFWQPVGGGNSVAVCGLIGVFSVWQVRRRPAMGLVRFLGALIWGGGGIWLSLHADIHGPALIAGLVVGALAFALPSGAVRHA